MQGSFLQTDSQSETLVWITPRRYHSSDAAYANLSLWPTASPSAYLSPSQAFAGDYPVFSSLSSHSPALWHSSWPLPCQIRFCEMVAMLAISGDSLGGDSPHCSVQSPAQHGQEIIYK